MTLTYTLVAAVALGLINLWLAGRTVQLRFATKTMMGDAGHPRLQARMRAQANFIEYVPLALVLMALIELARGATPLLFWLGVALVVARVIHPFGLERPAPNPFRAIGILGTWLVTAVLIGWGALILYGRV